MIIIRVGGTEKLRFEPHLVGKDFVITPRRGRRFPVPIGSNVYDEDVLLGVVTFMLPEQFQRCRVVFDPVVVVEPRNLTQEEWEAMREERDAVVPAECGDVPLEGSIAELALPGRLVDILDSHGLGRLLALRSALSQGDESVLSLDGIGPKSLDQIKAALEALEHYKGALEPVEMPSTRVDG